MYIDFLCQVYEGWTAVDLPVTGEHQFRVFPVLPQGIVGKGSTTQWYSFNMRTSELVHYS